MNIVNEDVVFTKKMLVNCSRLTYKQQSELIFGALLGMKLNLDRIIRIKKIDLASADFSKSPKADFHYVPKEKLQLTVYVS